MENFKAKERLPLIDMKKGFQILIFSRNVNVSMEKKKIIFQKKKKKEDGNKRKSSKHLQKKEVEKVRHKINIEKRWLIKQAPGEAVL